MLFHAQSLYTGSYTKFEGLATLYWFNSTAGVRFILKQGTSVLYSQVVDRSVSGINTGLPGTTLSITLDQLDGEIGLGVCFIVRIFHL